MTKQRVERAVKAAGMDAMSFMALESKMLHWFDDDDPDATGACVAYVDTGAAWVAAAGPLCASRQVSVVAERFVRAAGRSGRRASFFATERSGIDDFSQLLLGQQPVFRPREWLEALPRKRSLREQLRRARAKGVTIRRVTADDVGTGTPLRAELEALAKEWLWERHMAPMQFLVALELFVVPSVHLYFVAEVDGRIVALLSAVPIHARRGWLVEDIVRSSSAPNGTTELLFHALMVHVADSCELVTLGLTPLAGDVSFTLGLARRLGSTFFDFHGLHAFRKRLGPHHWESVWLLHPRGGPTWLHLTDGLRAFAGGSMLRFFARSLIRNPGGPPWLLALPLVPWTLALFSMTALGHAGWLGFRTDQLSAWSVFDTFMVVLLFHVSSRPRPLGLLVTMLAASADAALSIVHLHRVGLGSTVLEETLRGVATLAPCAASVLLGWALLGRRRAAVHALAASSEGAARARGSVTRNVVPSEGEERTSI